MSYVVLARKYRPQDLGALVGQDHVERALRNAIAMGRVAHAMLFCGARGTGKTSTARILARMLNCEQGPTATPCGVCAPCVEIAAGTAIDVHELDAASNRGINEIRELREGVGYAPARDRHKVYIIDEAHMLTTDAANAFLKTLEEPPPHVIFVLATTDPQRLPITIRSRCQRYDFRRIRAQEVTRALRAICESEGVALDDEALWLIAREGDGSMRDSLSVLDQVIAFGGEKLNGAEVAALLGVADRNRTLQLIRALVERDAPSALAALGAAHDHGIDLRTFARSLALEARDLLVIRIAGSAARDLVDRAESEVEQAAALIEQTPTPELERLANVLLELAEQVAKARHPRLVLELGVVRLCRATPLADLGALATRLDGLLRGAGAHLPALRASAARLGQSASATPSRGSRESGSSAQAQRSGDDTAEADSGRGRGGGADPRRALAGGTGLTGAVDPHRPPADRRPGRSLRTEDLAAWRKAAADGGDRVLAAHLDNVVVAQSEPGRVGLAFANAFHLEQARKPGVLPALAAAASEAFGGAFVVEAIGVDAQAREGSLAAQARRARTASREGQIEALRGHPAVRAIADSFGAAITSIRTQAEINAERPDVH